ncbi:hypothetical protein [Litoribacillus peritrichatus]
MEEKEYLEVTAANAFCQAYSKLYRVNAAFDHINLPRKPDVTVCIDGTPQDIEIAHLYHDQQEAMRLKNLCLQSPSGVIMAAQSHHSNVPLLTDLVQALNELLTKKSTKSYQSHHPWLVIRNGSPKWDKRDFEIALRSIAVPKHHPFREIWVVPDLTARQGLIRVYP